MNFKIFCALILIFSLLLLAGIASASKLDDASSDMFAQYSAMNINEIDEGNNLEMVQINRKSSKENFGIMENSEEASSDNGLDLSEISQDSSFGNSLEMVENTPVCLGEEGSRIIYVGQNKTLDGGNGTEDNPFESFELACNNLSGEEKVEINVFNGTYYLNSDLKFNTSNLFITGRGEVIIRNLENKEGCYASFGLASSEGNFTFSNLIFDSSNCTYDLSNLILNRYFYAFKGKANLGILNNCTFTGFNESIIFSSQFDRKFIRCNFLDTYNHISNNPWYDGMLIDFEYCIISNGINLGVMPLARNSYLNLTYNNVWFGSNSINEYLYYKTTNSAGTYQEAEANITRYAVFSSYENYLGNDTFEIIGKLMWNDSTTDGIELLNPIITKLSSRTGEIVKSTILENGIFNLRYKSNSIDNVIEVDLDSQEIILEFKNGVQVMANPIYVGDEQIIAAVLPKAIDGIVNITVNNTSYEVLTNGMSSFNFTVPDELLEGIYEVNISVADSENHVYGVNSTNWTISKLNRDILVVSPAKSYITDEFINITVLLENGATGNVSVFSSDRNITKESFGSSVEMDISSLLNAGENDITVFYSGNKRYLNQTKHEKIFVNRIYPDINITVPRNPIVGEEVNIAVTLPSNATGNLLLSVGDENIPIDDFSGEINLCISDWLNTGNNLLSVKYSGDDFWDAQIKKETIYLDKKTPVMAVGLISDIVRVGENVILEVDLPEDAIGTISANGISFNKTGKSTIVNIPALASAINQINLTYNGDSIYHAVSQVINVSVEKWNLSPDEMKITVTNHTVPNFSINISDATGTITVKVNGKDYSETLLDGSASLNIYDLMPGTYDAAVVYSGSDKYNPLSANVRFSVPKPVLKADDINMLYTSGKRYGVYITASGSPAVGKTVVFTIDGKKRTAVTDSNGYASVKIDLAPRTAKYSVSCEYQGVKVSNKVKVKSILQAKNLKVKKSAKLLKIKVSLKKVNGKYLKGKKITLKFKGKKYLAKTNKKGFATFKINKKIIKKLKAGKSYKYQVNYLKDNVSKRISVKT